MVFMFSQNQAFVIPKLSSNISVATLDDYYNHKRVSLEEMYEKTMSKSLGICLKKKVFISSNSNFRPIAMFIFLLF